MDFDLPIAYRGVDLNDVAYGPDGRNLRGIRLSRAVYGDVRGEGYREKRSLGDGYDAGNVFLGFRAVELSGIVYGESRADLWDRLQALRRAFTPTLAFAGAPGDLGFMPLTFSRRTLLTTPWPTGIIPLQLLMRPENQPHFVVSQDRLEGVDENGFAIEFSALGWCRDPLIYVQPGAGEESSQEDLISGASGSGSMPNRGDYPAPVNFLLNVAAGGTQRTFRFSGVGTAFNVIIPASSNPRLVRVDSSLKVVTYAETIGGISTEVLNMDLITFDTGLTWPRVPTVATSPYSWTSTGGSLAVGSKVFYNEAFA